MSENFASHLTQTQFPPTSQHCPPALTRPEPYPSKLETRNPKLLFRVSFGSGKKVGNQREKRLELESIVSYINSINKIRKCREIIG